ncbi:TIGR00341 family protein [Candidatus Peregrinibacteria bacterium]|nr:TIGR00341 family protein [Candidatus Peregrinibacteria bacterium]
MPDQQVQNKPIKIEKKETKESPLLGDELKKSSTPESDQIVVTKSSFWDKFIFKVSVEEKALITENIINEITFSSLYWILLVISIIIATFGLLQNSVAIIIGAMLIAPLLRPIKALAFAITTGQPKYFWKAFLMLFLSIIFAVSTSYLVSLAVPLKIETAEILARISPNLLDLFIAIAAGLIAVLSLYFKKLSENLAGVAMAAAILPPLAVTGIELALGNIGAVWGSFFLFLTNFFAILAVGVVIFFLYGFSPSRDGTKFRSLRVVFMVFMFLAIISFPLFSSFTKITDKINLEEQLTIIFEDSIATEYPELRLENINVVDFDDRRVEVLGRLRVPQEYDFNLLKKDEISQNLKNALNREVDLEIELIPVIKISKI